MTLIDRALELARTGAARNEVELHRLLEAEGFALTETHLKSPAMRKLLKARFKQAPKRDTPPDAGSRLSRR